MGQAKPFFRRFYQIAVFLLILALFFFSLYKILAISGVLNSVVFGASCGQSDWGESWCEQGRSWCEQFCHWSPFPTKTPTPTLPGPSPTVPPEPTLTPKPGKPSPTRTLKQTPSEEQPSEPSVGGSEPGLPGPPVCQAEVPPAPVLLSVVPSGSGQVDLRWTEVSPVTHYSISYGLNSGNYLYGVDNTGKVISFTIGSLDSARDYCFAVRAVNDCAPGELSNEICTGQVLGTATGQVLGASTLGTTGMLGDELFEVLFIIGSVCLGLGLGKKQALRRLRTPTERRKG